MRLLAKLFGRKPPLQPPPAFRIPIIPAPADYPVSLTPPGKPRKRGVDPVQYAADLAAYRQAYRDRNRALAAYSRRRCQEMGVKEYKWLCAVSGTCDIADRNNGKWFSYDHPPPEGHPGEGECHASDWCRCITRSAIPGLEPRD